MLSSLEYLEIILRHRFSSLTKKNLRGGFNDPPPSTISGQCIDFHQNIANFWTKSAIFRLESMKRLSFNVLTYFEHFPIVPRDPLPNILTKGGSLNPPQLFRGFGNKGILHDPWWTYRHEY